ncbi:8556_t:CDS:2, partial [Acaulospora morrowiae]
PASSSSILITPGRSRRNITGTNAIDDGDPRDRKNKGKAVAYNADEDDEQGDENTPLLGEEAEAPPQKPIGLTTFNRIFQRRSHEPVILNVLTPTKVEGPIRVEPKVYFANERTFFSWMRFSVLLGTLSLGLFNAATVENKTAMLFGAVYAFISVGVLIYSLLQYNKRNKMINGRYPGPYDDPIGPTFVCLSIFVAVGLNFYLKFAPRMIEGGETVNNTVMFTIQE